MNINDILKDLKDFEAIVMRIKNGENAVTVLSEIPPELKVRIKNMAIALTNIL